MRDGWGKPKSCWNFAPELSISRKLAGLDLSGFGYYFPKKKLHFQWVKKSGRLGEKVITKKE